MGVSASRAIMYFLGVILVVGALLMFFFQTGLDRWVPIGLLAAGVLLIIGLAVLSFAGNAPSEHRVRDGRRSDRGYDDGGDVTVIKK